MLPNHFIATTLPNDLCSWTLPSLLGKLMQRAEDRYGTRDMSFTILDVEFGPSPVPHIWYPGDCKHIIVRLAPNALDDEHIALHQLAHECLHLLAPVVGMSALVLEEGLATVFSEDFMFERFGLSGMTTDKRYAYAARLVRQLLETVPLAIKVLRSHEPCLSRIIAEHFKKHLPQVKPELAEKLTAHFYSLTEKDIDNADAASV